MSHLDPDNPIRVSNAECRLVVVQDQMQPCPYLDGETARMPLRLPVGSVTPEVTDRLLAMGYRRSGDFVYRAQCPNCRECKPTRVDVEHFRRTTSMTRIKRRGERDLTHRWGEPRVDAKRIWLFNQHRNQRGLSQGSTPIDAESYRSFLSDTCCETQELAIRLADELVAVAIVDIGKTSISAVYTHFDPHAGRYSLGTYAILRQIEFAIATGRRYVYLGMYVADNSHLNYKARFQPQQRLDQGKWCDITKDG
ncbi:MAG: arginyltransferase [Rubripirellula sp.]